MLQKLTNNSDKKPDYEVLENLKIVWSYLNLEHPLEKSDAILVFG